MAESIIKTIISTTINIIPPRLYSTTKNISSINEVITLEEAPRDQHGVAQ